MAQGEIKYNDLNIIGALAMRDDITWGTGSSTVQKQIILASTGVNVGIDIQTLGTGILRVPTGYEANILSDSRAITNRAYTDAHIAGKNLDSSVTSPGAPQNNQAILWNQAGSKFIMGTVALGRVFRDGLTDDGTNVSLGGNVTVNVPNVVNTIAGTMQFQANFGSGASPSGFKAIAVSAGVNNAGMFAGLAALDMTNTSMTVTANFSGAMKYNADYSASYTARSLTDLGYFQSHLVAKPASALLITPTGTEDGYIVYWNNSTGKYDLKAGAAVGPIPDQTILGNISGSTAGPSALTGAQVNTMLPVFTTSLKGLAPASGGGTTNFLRADGAWAAAGGGITNSAANNELAKSNGTNLIGSGMYNTSVGLYLFGTGLGGTSRSLIADGTASDINLNIQPKGPGGVLQMGAGSSPGPSYLYGQLVQINAQGSYIFLNTSPATGASSGNISLQGGNGGVGGTGNYDGGSILINSGLKSGSGNDGAVYIQSTGTLLSFFNATAVVKQSAVTTAQGIADALVAYGLLPTSTISGAGSGTVTSVSFTGGLISVATPTTTPAFTVAGTSGGIPYFSSTSTWASSALLTANAVMIGGGAGAAPSTTSTAAGILTFIGTPTSANLATAVTDETGTGALVFAGSPAFTGTPTLGTLGYSDTGILFSLQSSTNSYNQVIVQNTSNGSAASANFVVNNDVSTATTFYGELGMNSSGFTGSGSFNIASTVYLDSISSDLVIGTLANKTLHFVTNGATTDNMSITGAGVFTLTTNISGSAWNSTWSANANNQISRTFTDSLTLRATASDAATANYFNPTFIITSTTQNPIGLNLDVTYSQVGGINTTVNSSFTVAGMTPGTYTSVAPASTSGSGTGALFTVIVASATVITSITQTTPGTGYKVNDTITFNGSQFGSGSGSAVYIITGVVGISLGTTATPMRINTIGANGTITVPKLIDFYYEGTNCGSIRTPGGGGLRWYDGGGSETFRSTNGVFFVTAATILNGGTTISGAGAFTINGVATTTNSSILSNYVNPVNGVSTSSAYSYGGTSGGIFAINNFQSKYRTAGTIGAGNAGVGIPSAIALISGGTGYSVGNGIATSGGTGSGFVVNITSQSGGVITGIVFSAGIGGAANGSGYTINDVLTVLTGGANATITITAVDYAGTIMAFDDVNSFTDARSNNKYFSFMARPTYNITSTQVGTIAGFYYAPTLTNTGNFINGGIIIVPTGVVNGIGSAIPDATWYIKGSGAIPTLKTIGAGSGTNYSIRSFKSDGLTEIFSLRDNGSAAFPSINRMQATTAFSLVMLDPANGNLDTMTYENLLNEVKDLIASLTFELASENWNLKSQRLIDLLNDRINNIS